MSDRELTSLELVEAFERYPGIVPTWPRLIRERALAEAAPPPLDGLRDALEAGWRLAEDLDSNHARWVITQMADRAGIAFDFGYRSEPNNRLREQLAEALVALRDEGETPSRDPDDKSGTFPCYCGGPDPGTDGNCRNCDGATYRMADGRTPDL